MSLKENLRFVGFFLPLTPDYRRSIALTKEVHMIGRIRVRYSKCNATARIKAAEETKNMIHASPIFLFSVCISGCFGENKVKSSSCNQPSKIGSVLFNHATIVNIFMRSGTISHSRLWLLILYPVSASILFMLFSWLSNNIL